MLRFGGFGNSQSCRLRISVSQNQTVKMSRGIMANEAYDIDAGETTKLAEDTVSSVSRANEIFGRTLRDGSIPIVLEPGAGCCGIGSPFYLTVPEGCYAMVQRFGADFDTPAGKSIWPPGFHFVAPWVRVKYLVTKQTFVFDTPVKGCKTADNVTVTIDVTLSLRIMGDESKGEDPELVRTFVYKMQPAGLSQQLKDAQEEAVRALARSVNHTEVYGLRSAESPNQVGEQTDDAKGKQGANVTDVMKRSLNNQFNKYGVQITDVAIKNVRLPREIAMQMQEKTTYASVIAEQKMKQQNDLQMLGFKEEIETAQQKKKEEQLAEEAEGIRVAAEKTQELYTVQAETKKMVAEMKELENAAVREIKSKDALDIEKVKTETVQIKQSIEAAAKAEVAKLQAEQAAYVQQKDADIIRVKAKYRAMCNKAIAEAEGTVADKLKAKREYDVSKKKLNLYENLAKNKNVVISGKGNDNLLANMLVAQRESQILLNVDSKGIATK